MQSQGDNAMGTAIYVTKECLHRAATVEEKTDGLVTIDYAQGEIVAVLNAPKDADYALITCASIGGQGTFPMTLQQKKNIKSNLFVRVSARGDKNGAAAILVDKLCNPVKMVKVTRFGSGFSVQLNDM